MTDLERFDRQLDQLGRALQRKLNLRPGPFARLVARSRRHLPRSTYREALHLAEAARVADNPRLARTLDFEALQRSGLRIRRQVGALDPAGTRRRHWAATAGSIAINLALVVGLYIGVLVWRGFVP